MLLRQVRKAGVPHRLLCSNVSSPVEDVVVIGGGIVGCSLAYHLAKQGLRRVVLLEKSELTAGSTWHAAGLTTFFHPRSSLRTLHYCSVGTYVHIERETGQDIGFHRPGSLRLATSPVRLEEIRFQISRKGPHGAPQRLLLPEEIVRLVPILDMEGILGGLYTPYDGHVDPYSLTQAFAQGARTQGARILMPVEARGLKALPGDRWEVATSEGALVTRHVVNAAGLWAREVGQMAGLDLPLVPVQHQYVVTSPVPEVERLEREMPVLRHLDGSFYARQEKDGLLIGPYESEDSMETCAEWAEAGVPTGFGKELFAPDVDRLHPHLEAAVRLLPCFARAGIRSVVNGPITYAPDLLPLIGPSSRPNLWVAVGFGYGIIHAGGAGKFLSDWIAHGEAPYDLRECDPARFGTWADLPFTIAKARESYGMNNAVTFPYEERFAGRPTRRRSGLHDVLVRSGAHMGFSNGWEVPSWFSSEDCPPGYEPTFHRQHWQPAVLAECAAAQIAVAVADVSSDGKFLVSGASCAPFLDALASGSIPSRRNGANTVMCLTSKAKVHSILTVARISDSSFFVTAPRDTELQDLRWLQLQSRLLGLAVDVENVTDTFGGLAVLGPHSEGLLSRALGVDLPGPESTFVKVDLGPEAGEVFLLRSRLGLRGWNLYCRRGSVLFLHRRIFREGLPFGKKKGVRSWRRTRVGIRNLGQRAIDALRIEAGVVAVGNEVSLDISPVAAGLMGSVDLSKSELCRIASEESPPGSELVLLTVRSPVSPTGDECVWCEDQIVGHVTSACHSPSLGTPLAFAYLPAFLAKGGTVVKVELLGELLEAEVTTSGRFSLEVLHP